MIHRGRHEVRGEGQEAEKKPSRKGKIPAAIAVLALAGSIVVSLDSNNKPSSMEIPDLIPTSVPETVTTTIPEIIPDRSPSTTESKPSIEQYVVKEEYDLDDLVRYARETEFASDSVSQQTLIESIKSDEFISQIESAVSEAVLELTGKNITFNLDPATGIELRNTRPDLDPYVYAQVMSNFITNLSLLPRGLITLPESYNIYLDYLPKTTPDGRESVDTDIGGTVHNRDRVLSLDIDSASSLSILLHELVHSAQVTDSDIVYNGNYALLRRAGQEQFGSVASMLEAITELGNQEVEPDILETARLLVLCEAKEPDPLWEDGAYTFQLIHERGVLPSAVTEKFPILDLLRTKQLTVLQEISRVAGIDMGAMLAFIERFGTTHPKVIAEIADADILPYMSAYEGSALGQLEEIEKQPPVRTIMSGLHIVDVRQTDVPEYLVLHPTQIRINDTRMDYSLDIIIPNDSHSDSTNLFELAQNEGIQNEGINNVVFPAGVVEILGLLFPDLKDYINFGYSIHRTEKYSRYVLEMSQEFLAQKIDSDRLVGWLSDDGTFEFFDNRSK